MHQFPIILIPPAIQQARSAQPPAPTFTEPLPQQPGPEPEKANATIIAVEATAVTVPSAAIASQGGTVPGLLLFLVAAAAIAAQVWRQITTYPQRKREHDRQVAAYPRKLEAYNRKKHQHEKEVKAARSPERVAEFQYKLVLDVLRRTIPHNGTSSRAQRGWSEAEFGNHLRRYFPGKIHTGLTLIIPGYEHPYTPDFAYIDSSLNLCFDIEVDEPYAYSSGEPTHFAEAWKDNNRNNFFIDKGWIVIRFSEEQVVRWPRSCCKTVAGAIAQVIGDSSMLNQFAHIPDLQPIRQWTEEEAKQMAIAEYRDKYCGQK